jgi:hypothetical protein
MLKRPSAIAARSVGQELKKKERDKNSLEEHLPVQCSVVGMFAKTHSLPPQLLH